MSPRTVTDPLPREAPVVRASDSVGDAARAVLDSALPALPVVDEHERLVGIFGEREFLGAVFPGYLNELRYAGFVKRSLEDALEKRRGCRTEPVSAYMNTDHIDVGTDFSDAEVAEIFLHHRVLLVPVVDHDRKVAGVITRADFFRSVADRILAS
jgi:CBS-domain-containing membrane protein